MLSIDCLGCSSKRKDRNQPTHKICAREDSLVAPRVRRRSPRIVLAVKWQDVRYCCEALPLLRHLHCIEGQLRLDGDCESGHVGRLHGQPVGVLIDEALPEPQRKKCSGMPLQAVWMASNTARSISVTEGLLLLRTSGNGWLRLTTCALQLNVEHAAA